MRAPRPLLLSLALGLGCLPPTTEPTEPVAFCESELGYRYDPDQLLTTWPDDHWTVPDTTSRTGLRLALDPLDPALSIFPENYRNVLVDAATLDGFGTTPELIFRFDGPLPADLDTLELVLLSQAEDGVWREHPFERSRTEDGSTLLVRPWRPLPAARPALLALAAEPLDGGRCISPAPALRALLTDAGAPLHERYRAGLDALGWQAAEVGAMTVFTTQSAGLDDEAVLADVALRNPGLDRPMECEPTSAGIRCDGRITLGDYRDPETRRVPAGEPLVVRDEYDVPVRLWLPDDLGRGAPYPTVICGHSLGNDKNSCQAVARRAGPLGVATIAIDAVEHGEHPDRSGDGTTIDIIMALAGFTIDPPSLDPMLLRDNMRQAGWDKLQLLRAIQTGWDFDDDGFVDLDGARVSYIGISLGGIMGPHLLALAPELHAGVLGVPGGGLVELFVRSGLFAPVARALLPEDWSEDDLTRALPLMQALVDAGDPLVFADQLARGRADNQTHVAALMAWDDPIVPNLATTRLAQALALETVGQELIVIPGVPQVGGPVLGNLPEGPTGGLLQFEEVQTEPGGPWESAGHVNVPQSEQWKEVIDVFIASLANDATPELIEPPLSPTPGCGSPAIRRSAAEAGPAPAAPCR